MKLNRTNKAGFTLVEVMIVVAIIGLLAAIAIPNFVRARTTSQRNACIVNLKQIEGAKATWALENHKVASDAPALTDLSGTTDSYIRDVPACPGGGTYTPNAVSTKATCNNVDGHSL